MLLRSVLSLFLVACICLPASAQTGVNLIWQNEYLNTAGASARVWNAIEPHANGVTVAGSTSTQLGFGMYLARYASGQLLWDTTLRTAGTSSFRWLATDAQGNLYAAGAEVIGSNSQRQIHLAKFTPAGALVWRTTYRGPANQFAAVTHMKLSGSHFYLSGQQLSNGTERPFVAKFDLNGSLVWNQAFQSTQSAFFNRIDIGPSGTVTAVGSADNAFSFLVVQYSASGALNWQYPATLTSSLTQYLADVVVDAAGNTYAVGAKESGVFETDIITLKLGPGGNKIWEKNLNNQDENEGRAIRMAPNGDVLTFGNLSNAAFALVIRYDTAGNQLWTRSFQVGDQPLITAVAVDPAGDIFVGVNDIDSVGIARVTPAGVLAAKKAYGLEQANFVSGLALSAGSVWMAGNQGAQGQATLFGFQPATLQQTQLVESLGEPLSDARPGAIATDGTHVWFSTFSDDGDSAVFSVTKTTASGALVWERSLKYATVISGYPFLAPDGAGGVVGLFQNSRNVGGGQIGLVKYDANGNQVFLNLLGSSISPLLSSGGLAVAPNGDIVIAANDATNRQLILSRYSAAGDQQWSVTYQSPATSFPVARAFQLQLTPQGKIVVVASHRGTNNDNDLHLLQFSAAGALEWNADVANQAGNVVGFAGMQILPNGEIAVFGGSTILQYAAARFSSAGARLWLYQGQNPFSAAPRSMATDAQGNTYLCFSTNSHVLIRKLDAAGALLDEGQFSVPTTGSFYFPRHCANVGGRVVILGDHQMPGNQSVPFQMLVDAQLNLVFTQIDSGTTAQIQAMATDPQGGLYASYLTGDIALGSGARGTLVRKFGIGTVGIDPERWANPQNIKLYPNPASRLISVSLDVMEPGVHRIALCDLQGRVLAPLFAGDLAPGPNTLDLRLPDGLPAGMYLIQVAGPLGMAYSRLIVR